MKRFRQHITGLSAAALLGAAALTGVTSASADTINIRIASGHPPTVVYAGLMKSFFQTELKKAIESQTDHKVYFIEGYSGSIVKVFDTFEGVPERRRRYRWLLLLLRSLQASDACLPDHVALRHHGSGAERWRSGGYLQPVSEPGRTLPGLRPDASRDYW